jgi:osmotically-inducible protein OsmY
MMTRLLLKSLTVVLVMSALNACVPLVVGGAMLGGGLVATDRRTTGTQIEDEAIELKARGRARELATLGQISFTSYNRIVLITGEVPAENEKQAVGKAIAAMENVKGVVNELTLAPNSHIGNRSNDTLLTTKVKASLVDAKDVQANAFKVVSERGVIYLMGRVTAAEAERGTDIARAVPGVVKVVRVFEMLTDEEVGRLGRAGAGAAAAAGAASAPRP